jgi:hypothetical protein
MAPQNTVPLVLNNWELYFLIIWNNRFIDAATVVIEVINGGAGLNCEVYNNIFANTPGK